METNHLPEEIITEILSRLPVKSLLKFKCVSKSWRSLISSKHFVKTHLGNSKKNKTFAYHSIISTALDPWNNPWRFKACSLSSLLIEPITRAFPLDYSLPRINLRDILLVGSCNGLICIIVNINRFFVLNLSTRESKELPDFFSGLNLSVAEKKCGLFCRYGFGFDESSGDYKIYAVYTMTGLLTAYIGRLYSLKADSWRKVAFINDGLLIQSPGKFVSGKLHWRGDCGPKWEILCLDLKTENLGYVEHPITCLNAEVYPELGVLDGRLCVYCDYDTTKLDIWIWNKYGVEDSWSKMLTIPYLSESWVPPYATWSTRLTPLFLLSSDEVLFAYGTIFSLYNMKNHSVRQLDTVYSACECVHEVDVYTESLVSLS